MDISISSILQSPYAVTRYSFKEKIGLPADGEQLLEPITGELTVTRNSDQLLQVTGDFDARLKLHCDRCGNEYETPVHHFSLEEHLEVTDEPTTSVEVEEQVYAGGNLDVTDLIRQALLLSLPSRRLCGCEPLAHKTDATATDPRWAALNALREDADGKSL